MRPSIKPGLKQGPLKHMRVSRVASLRPDAQQATKSFWIWLLFNPSGSPRRLLRLALFHANGRPRGAFRVLVLHSNGRPRSPFRQWMSNPKRLQPASDHEGAPIDAQLTPRARRIHAALRSAMARRKNEAP